ncbi:hypothetical protein XPA_002026 [Xanthoria parietina]
MSTCGKAVGLEDKAPEENPESKLGRILTYFGVDHTELLQSIRNDTVTRELHARQKHLGLMIKDEAQKEFKDWRKLEPLLAEFLEKNGAMLSRLQQSCSTS